MSKVIVKVWNPPCSRDLLGFGQKIQEKFPKTVAFHLEGARPSDINVIFAESALSSQMLIEVCLQTGLPESFCVALATILKGEVLVFFEKIQASSIDVTINGRLISINQ